MPELTKSQETEAGAASLRLDIAAAVFLSTLGLLTIVIGEATIREDIRADFVGPKAFPFAIGGFLMFAGIAVAMRDIRALRSSRQSAYEVIEEDDVTKPASGQRAFVMMTLTVACAALLVPLGFPITIALYLGAANYVMGHRAIWIVAVLPIVFSVVTYLLFARALGIFLPTGPLTEFLRSIGAR